ncbi:MAG: alpha/beta hydrolase [Myxococcaceae bacterium]
MRLLLTVSIITLSACASTGPCLGPPPDMLLDQGVTRTAYRTEAPGAECLQSYEWKGAAPVRGAVVVVHGIRDHATRYQALADALAAKGVVVYGTDLRGHGKSGGDRQRFDSIDDLVADVERTVAEAKKRNPGVPVFVYGHSLGGLITASYGLAHGDEINGLILSGPALKLLPGVSGGAKAGAHFFGALIPSLHVQEVDDTEFVREPEAKKELASDPEVDHSALPARSAAASLDAIDLIQAKMSQLSVPFLVMHGSQDKATNIEGSQQLYESAKSTDKTFKKWEGTYHDLLHEPERDQVVQTTVEWVDARIGQR